MGAVGYAVDAGQQVQKERPEEGDRAAAEAEEEDSDEEADKPAGFQLYDIELEPALQEYVYRQATAVGIEPEIVFAIMWRESRFQIDAVGYNRNGTVDVGLMQINSCNWGWLAAEGMDVHDPRGNIDAGIRMLAIYCEKYPIREAIAAYAAGEAGMLRGGGLGYADSILDGDGPWMVDVL